MVHVERSTDGPTSSTHILTLRPGAPETDITEAYTVVVSLVKQAKNICMIVGQPATPKDINHGKPVEKVDGRDIAVAGKFPIRMRHGDVVVLDDATQEERWMKTIIRNAHRQELSVSFVRINQSRVRSDIQPHSISHGAGRKKQIRMDMYRYRGEPIQEKSVEERNTIYKIIGLTEQETQILDLAFQNKTYRQISLATGVPRGSLTFHFCKILEKFNNWLT